MVKWVREHSLSLFFAFAFVAFTVATIILGRHEFAETQAQHGQPDEGFWAWWSFEYTMSLVADIFGALALVLFTKWFYEKRSAESK